MKDLQFFLESKTNLKDIKKYAEEWSKYYTYNCEDFQNLCNSLLEGFNDGLKDNFKYAQTDEEREHIGSCIGLVNDMKKLVDKFY